MKFVLDKLTKTKKNMVIWYDANEKLEKSFLSERKVNKCKKRIYTQNAKKKHLEKKTNFISYDHSQILWCFKIDVY